MNLAERTLAMTTLKRTRLVRDDDGKEYRVRVLRKRLLPLRPWLVDALRDYMKILPPGEWLFPRTKENSWRCRVWRAWKVVCDRAGVRDCRVHDIRHSVASRLAARDVILARDVLDHSDLKTTGLYVHSLNLHAQFLRAQSAIESAPPPDAFAARLDRIERMMAALLKSQGVQEQDEEPPPPPRPAEIRVPEPVPAPVKVSTKGRSWRYKSRLAVMQAAWAGNPGAQKRLQELGLKTWARDGKSVVGAHGEERPAGV